MLKWSRKFTRCIKCYSTEHRHKGNGLCIACYEKYRAEKPTRKENIKNQKEKWYNNNKEKYRETQNKNSSKYITTRYFINKIKNCKKGQPIRIKNVLYHIPEKHYKGKEKDFNWYINFIRENEHKF